MNDSVSQQRYYTHRAVPNEGQSSSRGTWVQKGKRSIFRNQTKRERKDTSFMRQARSTTLYEVAKNTIWQFVPLRLTKSMNHQTNFRSAQEKMPIQQLQQTLMVKSRSWIEFEENINCKQETKRTRHITSWQTKMGDPCCLPTWDHILFFVVATCCLILEAS